MAINLAKFSLSSRFVFRVVTWLIKLDTFHYFRHAVELLSLPLLTYIMEIQMKSEFAIKRMFLAILSLIAIVMSTNALAIDTSQLTPEQTKAIATSVKESIDQTAKAAEAPGGTNDQSILNKYFGAGVMANVDFGGKKNRRVSSASTVAGIVRIDEESKAQIGFMLEAHKFISGAPTSSSPYVHGPFLGLVVSGQASIDTGILGYMWGFRQPQTTQTLNIGFGLSISPKAQILGDGIVEGQPLPSGETEVRYKKTTLYGAAFVVSFGF